jgi:hypothetical protein
MAKRVAKRETNARRLAKGKPEHHKRETNAERASSLSQETGLSAETILWILEGIPVLIAKDPDSEDPESTSLATLEGGMSRSIGRLVKQVHRYCSDKKWTSYQKRVACEQLVSLANQLTRSIFDLAAEFREPFREIAEELPLFPCLFPAHPDTLRELQTLMWDGFNLGKRHALKLRAAPGRKTFSTETWVNSFLMRLIAIIHDATRREDDEPDPGINYGFDTSQVEDRDVPLTPQNAKQWLDMIWQVLLTGIPNPETHPQLRKLGQHPSRTERAHFG